MSDEGLLGCEDVQPSWDDQMLLLLAAASSIGSRWILSAAHLTWNIDYSYTSCRLQGFVRVCVEILEGLPEIDELSAVACVRGDGELMGVRVITVA